MSAHIYLVPHDFSPVAAAATHHAIQLARQTKAEVHLLHIIKADNERGAAKAKLNDFIGKLALKSTDPKVVANIEKGSIFEDIGKMAAKMKATLIIMGTHGSKGMQKVFGSFAIKVIKSAECPFVIVQDKVPAEKIGKIVIPFSLASESLQIINFAADLAHVFDSEMHLVANAEKDALLNRKIHNFIEVIKKKLATKELEFTIKLLEGNDSFLTKIFNYGKTVKTDMFAIAYHSDSILPQFDTFAQNIITNELKIPVLIVNSKQQGNFYF
ncbi:MAG: universal stress protein [Bacteroidota bacterium]